MGSTAVRAQVNRPTGRGQAGDVRGTLLSKACGLFGIVAMLGACTASSIDRATAQYDAVEHQIALGDAKDQVLSILEPTQASLPRNARKKPDRYLKDGVHVEIFYMRTSHQRDGITTDDEFTPYIFNDGKLVGIGWHLIGGIKSHAQVRPRSDPPLGFGHRRIIIY
ncbi:MAG: DUF3192 domain-containing protein [Desulfurellaceae bacterium]|nr:DUF3192 domain-containing protein [Desulfurellaceae bacterium]